MAKKQFKAESKRLLDIMINSIYTHKEIFLREIISNASDAIDKLAYLALTDDGVGMSREDFRIDISADKQSRTLTVSDNGMGMTREELESNLGTIARSGSRQFKEEMEEAGDIDIIGQFGVGFYSAFMVSSQVTVVSRAYGQETAHMWISNGADGYTISECEKDGVGTDVIMTIKEDTEEEKYTQYLESYRISALIKKYSDYIRYPVRMEMEHSHLKEGSPEDKPEYETVTEEETLNSMVPIWQRTKAEVTDEELSDFYKEKFGNFEDPLATIQVNAEGAVTYKALLFIPARTPYDYYTKEYKKGLQLYSSGVLIMDSCEDLLPEHFRFVKGVVDTQDISLNISREMLQHTRQMKVIAGALEKRIKTELKKMLDTDREKYETFFKNFGLQLKYGTVGEYGMHKELLRDLLIFETSTQEKPATLSEYVSRMPEQQKHIYYAAGESKQRILSLPQAEPVRERGFEMLCLSEDVDEFVMQILTEHEGKKLMSINSDMAELLSEEEKKEAEKAGQDNKQLLEFVKESLGGAVKDVRISTKLKSHAVFLSTEGEMSIEMEKYLNAIQPDAGIKADKVLELNAEHEAFNAIKKAFDIDKEKAAKYAKILYCQALLIAGIPLENPSEYSDMVCGLMS